MYDDLDRVREVNALTVGASVLVSMASAYDAAGRRTNLTAKRGATKDFENVYTFDNADRMTSVTQQSQTGGVAVAPKHVAFDYNDAGQFTGIDRYEAVDTSSNWVASTDFDYEPGGRLKQVLHVAPGSGGIAFLGWYDLTYDRANRITGITTTISVGASRSFTSDTADYIYDDRDQLIAASHTASVYPDEDYSYDPTGNRTESHIHGAGYDTGADNRIVSDGTYWYLHDNEGNIVEKRLGSETGTLVMRSTWDHRNRLTKVELFDESTGDPLRSVSYGYDAFNRRISRYLDEGADGSIDDKDFYYFDGTDTVLVLDENLAVEHRYLHGPAVDQVLADEAFDPSTGTLDDVYWALADHQGTVRDVLTFDGTHAVHHEHVDWDAYGRLLQVKNGSTVDPSKTPTMSQGYTGRDHDPATRLQNNLHRWYNPDLGRWMSQDPISFAGGDQNLYHYVFASPTNYIDPFGLGVWDTIVDWYWYNPLANVGTAVGTWLFVDVPGDAAEMTEEFEYNSERYNRILDDLEQGECPRSMSETIDTDATERTITRIAEANVQINAASLGGELIPTGPASVAGGAAGKVVRPAQKILTGQLHHPISKRIGRALNEHRTLRGHYRPRDPRFVTQACDEAAHKGYQKWHRDLDDEVIGWLREHDRATPQQFEDWLRRRYSQPDLKQRFPNGF